MLKIDKECQIGQANVKYNNICNSNCIVNDQHANVVEQQARKIILKGSNVGPSNVEPFNASMHARQPTTLSLENSTNIKCSKPSRTRNMLPPKKVLTPTSWKSKDGSNAASRCLDQSQHQKEKDRPIRNMETSCPTHFNAMGSLVRKAKNIDVSNLSNRALSSRSKGQSNPYQGEDIDVGKDDIENLKPVEKREVPRKSNILAVSGLLVANKGDSKKDKARQYVVMTKEKSMIGDASEGRATCGSRHKHTNITKTNEAPNSSSLLVGKKGLGDNLEDNSSRLFGKNHSRRQRGNASFMECSNGPIFSTKHVLSNEFTETNLKLPNRVELVGGYGKTNGGKFRRKRPLLEEKPYNKMSGDIDCDGATQQDLTPRLYNEDDEGVHRENLTSMPTMKQRRCMETNEDEVGGGYQNPFGVENDCEGVDQLGAYKLKKKWRKEIETNKYEDVMYDQHRIPVKDGISELTQDAVSKYCVERQCNCCSKPIDKPTWSVIFKIDGKEYISLAGHWSTKSCEKVRELSLQSVVQVTKVPRLAAWPNIWKASKPTGDSIGMYFFPHELRHDEELDQLVKEVIDKDLVLQAVIGEAEMLIFSSVLLPERYQTFQTNHYLWAAFRAKEDKGAATVEQEEVREKQHVSSQLDEVQSEESDQEMILMKCAKPLENQPSRSIQEVETCCIQGPTNMCHENESLEERSPRGSSHQAVCNSASTAISTDATTVAKAATAPSEATSFAANTASFPANHGPMDPSMEAPPSKHVFGIVIRETPHIGPIVQEFLDKMRRVDGLVDVMQGEEIVPTSGQADTTAMQ